MTRGRSWKLTDRQTRCKRERLIAFVQVSTYVWIHIHLYTHAPHTCCPVLSTGWAGWSWDNLIAAARAPPEPRTRFLKVTKLLGEMAASSLDGENTKCSRNILTNRMAREPFGSPDAVSALGASLTGCAESNGLHPVQKIVVHEFRLRQINRQISESLRKRGIFT